MPALGAVATAHRRDTGVFDLGDLADEPRLPDARSTRAFLGWGLAAYGLVLAVVLLMSLRTTDGRMIYVLDDPAIHLSMADTLAHHGTWGVVPDHFESASSAPLWTVLLAAWVRLVPGPSSVAPLILNIAASVAIIALLGANQKVLFPGRRRPLDALVVMLLVVVVLFLPGLTMVGMEHTFHAALVLGALVLIQRQAEGRVDRGPRWLPYVLLAVAALTRFETAFIATGLAMALIVVHRNRRGAAIALAAAGLPILAFAIVNRAMGQGLVPNSVLAKTSVGEDPGSGLFEDVTGRLTRDPLVAVILATLLVALMVAWQRGRDALPGWTLPAIVFVVAAPLHVILARVGWYERYQAYLIVVGIYAVLGLLADVLPRRLDARPTGRGTQLGAGLLAVLLMFTWTKFDLTRQTPDAVEETYQQRYQAGVFLDRYYDGQPVATGELGYVSLLHHGPITDLFGLGDYEVLQQRRGAGQKVPPKYWSDLAERRGFDVVAAYPTTLFFRTPKDWILVGSWTIDSDVVTAWEPQFMFWATSPDAVPELKANLQDFEDELPDGVKLKINEYAELQAADVADDAPD
ncbi:MAG TPA: hypothetical protein VGJ86_14900 [Acidimicrobiales bacterium]|jgi:hypothetical protein